MKYVKFLQRIQLTVSHTVVPITRHQQNLMGFRKVKKPVKDTIKTRDIEGFTIILKGRTTNEEYKMKGCSSVSGRPGSGGRPRARGPRGHYRHPASPGTAEPRPSLLPDPGTFPVLHRCKHSPRPDKRCAPVLLKLILAWRC